MPYIGNPIYQSAFVTDQFSGDGTTTAFTMSVAPAGTTNVLVVVSGVVQDPTTYGVVGTTLNFSAAPPSGTGNISCRYLGIPVTGVTTTAYRTVTEFTATASQTTFTPPSYNVGFINVYLNGVLLGSADYTATNGTTVVLATGASAGNLVTVESFRIESVANAIANAAGSVSSSNLATNSVTTTKIADGSVTPAKLSTGGLYWDTSSNVGVGTTSPNAYSNQRSVTISGTTFSRVDFQVGGTGTAYMYSGVSNTNLGPSGASATLGLDTNGNTRLLIDSSGRVTLPYQPYCLVGRTSGKVSSGNTILFDQVNANTGSHYNTGTGRFTAPVAGNYFMSINALSTSSSGIEVSLKKNGNVVVNTRDGGGTGGYISTSASSVVYMNAGDYITGFVEGSYTMDGNNGYPYSGMAVYLVG